MKQSGLVRAGLGLAAVVALAACSVSVGGSSYSQKKMETKLHSLFVNKISSVKVGAAHCPSTLKLTEGVTFKCTLEVGDASVPYTGTLTDIKAKTSHVSFKATKAIIPANKAEAFVSQNLNDSSQGATVTCGDGKQILVESPGEIITCKLVLGSQTGEVHLKVKNLDGDVVTVQ